MKSMIRIAAVLAIVASLLLVLSPGRASAHPMGNFSINHYSALTVESGRVDILYIVDMAEIPTFQELGTIRADHSANLTPAQHDAYLVGKSAELLKGLSLLVDDKPDALTQYAARLTFPAGAGGLPTTRIEINLSASLGGDKGTLKYQDDNFPGRAGWKDIVANPGAEVSFTHSSVGTSDVTHGLTQYPTDISGPPSVVAAAIAFAPGAEVAKGSGQTQRASAISSTLAWAQGRADALTDLVAQKELPLGGLLVGLVVAFGLGAGHALSPGHGKTVVAAYLVGSKGTAAHAALLGFTVTLSHTIGVFLLGLVVLYAENYILPETIYPWLGFVSGLGIAIMGVGLFFQRLRTWRGASASSGHTHIHDGHTHTHGEHDHMHEQEQEHDLGHHAHARTHDHGDTHDPSVPHRHGPFGRAHTHVPADGQRVSLGSLLALGITGGIIPCPSALVVLLVAVASHRVGLGLILIVAFSLGLAAVLTSIGLLMVYSRGLLNRLRFGSGSLIGRLPVASALAVSCLGLLIAFEALKAGGILR